MSDENENMEFLQIVTAAKRKYKNIREIYLPKNALTFGLYK
jgi:hypothetical protein